MKDNIRKALLMSASSLTLKPVEYDDNVIPQNGIAVSDPVVEDDLDADDMETINQILAHSEFKVDPYAAFSEVDDTYATMNVTNEVSPWGDTKIEDLKAINGEEPEN